MVYSNVVDRGVFLISGTVAVLTYLCSGPFFVQIHFTPHEELLGEGEKWGKQNKRFYIFMI